MLYPEFLSECVPEPIFRFQTFKDDYRRSAFDTDAFDKLAVIVGESTWEVMNAKKALKVAWENSEDIIHEMEIFGRTMSVHHPKGLENTENHEIMKKIDLHKDKVKVVRRDGTPEKAFKNAAKVIERSYSCPFLAHNTMEPMNFFADVTDEKATFNNLIGFYVRAGGIPESPLFSNRFPAGAVENYLAEEWTVDSNITTGAFRAPRSNFIAGAEQAFLDEVAELAGKDPIDFRIELLEKAKQKPVGENNDYDPDRYIGVLELVKEKSDWNPSANADLNRGVAAYYCHNSYVAHVLDVNVEKNNPKIENVYCAIDCGIVVNPDAARNLAEGGTIDGIGTAMYGAMTFKDGVPQQNNFDTYRLIRHGEAPKNIEVSFVSNDVDPTGLGEPPFPPVMGALANALYKATGKRFYKQPFISELSTIKP